MNNCIFVGGLVEQPTLEVEGEMHKLAFNLAVHRTFKNHVDYNGAPFLSDFINNLILHQKLSIYDIPFEYRTAFSNFYITANRVSRHDNNEDRCRFIDFCFRDYDRINSDDNRHFSSFIESLLDFNAELIDRHQIKKPNRIPFE